MRNFTIALDAMGGDFGPHISLPASLKSLQKHPNLTLIIVGDSQQITPLLQTYHLSDHTRVKFVHAPEIITMEDDPVLVLRHRSQSSMLVALQLVAEGKADACVSAGNTGALMLLAKYILKTIKGISRPALVSAIPNKKGNNTYFMDLGANLQCECDTLFNFAVMGSVLCEKVESRSKPNVALLNIGRENNKGSDSIKHCASLLKETKYINYTGFVEANELFDGDADVIVTDGFSGNIALKSYEGMGRLFLSELKKAINTNWYTRLLGKLLNPLIKNQLKHLHPDLYNGASLVGLCGIVVKSHGGANVDAFSHAIDQATKEIQWQIPSCISTRLASVSAERDCLLHE
ncbi:phosphate acyltransferase PlsX [Psychromonas aquatilis]|uniref:Phosphate acyltransferase n=1 Tax=Psychromonas aquatilis TaxID=2005072 RepID=A0ABU9GQ88_9GAMM